MENNYGWGLPVQASTYAARIDNSLHILHAAMFLIFVLWAFYMTYCLIRYRARPNSKATYGHHTPWTSYIPDALILIFEVWLVFAIGLPLWAHIKEELPNPTAATVVEASAEQFAWVFRYPGSDGEFGKKNIRLVNADNPLGIDPEDPKGKDDIVTVNELVIPVNKPVLMELTSKDVIHSFFIPEFRIKQDMVPGMKIPLWVTPIKTGRFEIGCAQLCGSGHYRMRGDVYVKTAEEFEAWLQSKQVPQGI